MESLEAKKARSELVQAIKRAKSLEINVGIIFYEVEAELRLLHYRLLGAMLAGGFVVCAPLIIRIMDIFCVQQKLGMRMDYVAIDWLCLGIGVPSMLAFAWQLRTPKRTTLEKIVPAIDEITHRLHILEEESCDANQENH